MLQSLSTTVRPIVHYNIQIVTGFEIIIENFWPKVRKMLPEIKDWKQHFTNQEEKIFNNDQHASHYLFCYTSKANNSTS